MTCCKCLTTDFSDEVSTGYDCKGQFNNKISEEPENKASQQKSVQIGNEIDNGSSKASARKELSPVDSHETTNKKILAFIRKNVIGSDLTFEGPYGRKSLIYCDYTASGRPLKFIEDYIYQYVYPYYGNTHTTTSVASRQTSLFRDEAREIIKECVNASPEDVVIYAGSGTTGAIHKLVAALQLNQPEKAKTAVILVGPYEHHSNILPWKESGAKIIRIQEMTTGHIDLRDIEEKLQSLGDIAGPKIVTCSAASNVTGIVTDTDSISQLAHKYGAYAIFDYASAAPYVQIDMNPGEDTYKDAVVLSPHKFIGGPGTPGLLISKKHMFLNPVPNLAGGGTVLYVTRDTYAYLKDIEAREEGGTPAIIESIRCGMVFQLKQAVGPEYIETREEIMCKKAFRRWSANENMLILGSHTARRLPIFSFLTKHPVLGKYVHHNYMSVILNDVFGIQSRGGCACAGPYAEDLLGIAENLAQNFSKFLTEDSTDVGLRSPLEIMKPGFCRLNLAYFLDEETVDYIIEAVDMAVTDGWKLLPQYKHDPHTGVWKHRGVMSVDDDTPYSLRDIKYDQSDLGLHESVYQAVPSKKFQPKKMLAAARATFKKAERTYYEQESVCQDINHLMGQEELPLIWFIQPRQAWKILSLDKKAGTIMNLVTRQKSQVPFKPRRFTMRSVIRSIRSQSSQSD